MIVVLKNAIGPNGVRVPNAYLGGNGCQGFNTANRDEAHRFADAAEAQRLADHFRGWYRGFAGNVSIVIDAS